MRKMLELLLARSKSAEHPRLPDSKPCSTAHVQKERKICELALVIKTLACHEEHLLELLGRGESVERVRLYA